MLSAVGRVQTDNTSVGDEDYYVCPQMSKTPFSSVPTEQQRLSQLPHIFRIEGISAVLFVGAINKRTFDFLVRLIFRCVAMSEDPRQASYVNRTPVTVTVIFHRDLAVFANAVIRDTAQCDYRFCGLKI